MAIGKESRQKGYQHWYAPAPIDPDYPSGQIRKLISSDQQLENLLVAAKTMNVELIAVDTETTGLNTETEKLVGISIAISKTQSFYMPVGHNVGNNVSIDFALQVTAEFCRNTKKVLFYNARFDLRVLRAAGIEKYLPIIKIPFFDISVLTYNADTNIAMPKLKWSCLHFLGWKMRTYEEVLEGNVEDAEEGEEKEVETSGKEPAENFSYNDPAECYEYACDDALGTYNLIFALMPVFEEMKFICEVDNAVLFPLMIMEDRAVKIDMNTIKRLETETSEKIVNSQAEIYQMAQRSFNINSTKQVIDVLASLGIQPSKKTKSGKGLSADEEALEQIEDQHPIVRRLIDFKKLIKFKSTYCIPFINDFRPDLGGLRFAYKHNAVPTGRFASGSDAKNKYFCKINGQAIPKPHPAYYQFVPTEEDNPSDLFNFLGLQFERVEGKEGVEGFSLDGNVRAAFLPDNPWELILSLDYSGQELRIPTNLSGEPIWMNAFLLGGDVHKETAIMIYGLENYNRELRKSAKILNFGALFGGSAKTFSKQLGVPEYEAQIVLDKWWSGLAVLSAWCRSMENFGRTHGYVETYFGRKRRLRHWFSSMGKGSWRDIGYAERSCVNSPVQGLGADMIRISLLNIWNRMQRFIQEGSLKLKSTVHDEINFSVDYRDRVKFTEIALMLKEIMEIKIPEWKVPMIVDISIGRTWGTIFPFDYKGGVWVPRT